MEDFVGLFGNCLVYEGFKPGEAYVVRFSKDYSCEQIQESYNIIANTFEESKFLFIPADLEFEKVDMKTLVNLKRYIEGVIYEANRKNELRTTDS